MADLLINLLGPFEVNVDGESAVGFDSDKVRALLAFLVVEADRPHRREALAGLLWPDFTERSARTNLRRALANLRQVIGDQFAEPPYLTISRQTIKFNIDSDYSLDVKEFTELVDFDSRTPPEIDRFESAVELYRGGFLDGFSLSDSAPFYEWQLITREHLERKALGTLKQLANAFEELGLREQSLAIAYRHLGLDPWNESVHRQVMRLLASSGRKVEAIKHYDEMVASFKDELGVEPETGTRELVERISTGQYELDVVQIKERSVRGYLLREKLGSGSFGVVFRAFQAAVKRDVAIKIIQPAFANQPDFIRRFDVEAELVARLEHPHIVPLYDYWREPEGAYIVMRWLKGGNLREALKRGPWHLESAFTLLDEIASALDAAHRQGVIHRDIKPANILLDGEGHAYLSDFGIATLADNVYMPGLEVVSLAESKLSGTPEYISPEQVRNEKLTTAADIYALGIVAFEMIAGQHPFHESSADEMSLRHANEPLPDLITIRPDIPEQIDSVIQVATAKNPQNRYPDALAFSTALKSALTDTMLETTRAPSPPLEVILNPYKGLRPFQEADAVDFYGRESLIQTLVTRLNRGDSSEERFLAVVGPSGSGKSSAVKAGLIPALRQGAAPGSDHWFFSEMVPGQQPFEELEAALLAVAVRPSLDLLKVMTEGPKGISRAIRLTLADRASQLLLVIDQFEELFLFTSDIHEQTDFIDGLCHALDGPHSQLQLVITLRADYYDRPLQFLDFGELLRQKTEVVLPLSTEELEDAIINPASKVGLSLEADLVTSIIDDVHREPGALPLLQYALTELFENRQQDRLTKAAYEKIGGVAGAIGMRAEDLFLALNDQEREATRQIFLRLVIPGQEFQDSRRRALRAELTELRSEKFIDKTAELIEVLEQYGRYRLLTFDRDPATRAPTVEIAHEALLREWSRLKDWIDSGRNDIEQYQRLASSTAEWLEAGRETSFLLRGAKLDSLVNWLSTTDLAITPTDNEFIKSSFAELETQIEAERRRLEREKSLERRTRNLRIALVIVLMMALIGAAAAIVIIGADLTSEVVQAIIPPDQRASPSIASESTRIASMTENMEFSIEQGRGVAYSPDGQYISVTGFDNNATLRQADTGEIIRELQGHQDQVTNIAFSDEGDRLATTSKDGTVKIWEAETGQLIQTVGSTSGELVSPALSPDGQIIAATNFNSEYQRLSAHVWDVETGNELAVIGFGEYVGGLDFHPNGRFIAVPGENGKATIWDIESGEQTGKQIGIFSGHDGSVTDVAISSDGQQIITVGMDGTVRIFDLESRDLLSTIRASNVSIFGVDISSDGSMIAAALADGSVRLFSAPSGRELATFYGHESAALNVAFSPDGQFLASGGDDNTTIIWNLPSVEP